MLTEKKLLDARDEIIRMQDKQEKIFFELFEDIPKNKREIYEDLEGQLTDFLFNNLFYSKRDVGKFINSLYSNFWRGNTFHIKESKAKWRC